MVQNVVSPPATDFFVTGGTMRPTARSYVERPADQVLFESLLRGEYCYILDTRQMGKSSMMARCAHSLRKSGVSVAIIDLQSCGRSPAIEKWYYAQLLQIGEALNLDIEIKDSWQQYPEAAPVVRWTMAIRKVVLSQTNKKVTVFVDEIDFVRGLPFPTDEYFASIRGLFNERSVREGLDRLTSCLLGVAVPTDLVRSPELTPFNIGKQIELVDFTEEDIQGFARHWGENRNCLSDCYIGSGVGPGAIPFSPRS